MTDTTKPADRQLTTLSADRQLAQKLKVVAAHREMTLTDALERYAGPGISREYRRVIAEMNEQFDVGGEG